MTVTSQTNKVFHNGNDSATTFSFSPMVIYSNSELVVIHTDANGVETTLTEGTGATKYAVNVTLPGTGTITYPADEVTPLPTGESLTLKPVYTLEQQTDLENQGAYNADTLETQLDKFVRIDLQQQDDIDRAFRFPVSYQGSITTETDTPAAEQVLQINAAGTAMVWADLASGLGGAATSVEDVSLTAGAVGTATTYAREDHEHLLPTVTVAKGGTGATTESAARTNLGLGTAATVNTGAGSATLALGAQPWTTVASATTAEIGLAATSRVKISGTTTITSFGTVASGLARDVWFGGVLTLTHNATSLILPTGANITTASGDTARFVSEGSGNWRCLYYTTATGVPLGSAVDRQVFTSSGTWTKPAVATWVKVRVWSAGGGGERNSTQGAGGGGGGYFEADFLASDLGATETITIGAGGTGGASTGTATDGGDSSFGSHVTVTGGISGNTTTGGDGGGIAIGAFTGSTAWGGGPGGATADGGHSYWGGGGGGGGSGLGPDLGGSSIFGGGGGTYGNSSGAGGTSTYGGAGGNYNNSSPAAIPGGGGGCLYNTTGYDGARGEIEVVTW